ncbi:unnamed protein product [Gongylonema pulchrum]|uniref:Uncharacterized protein n=1 Tax=Gongylonema pulchrum TaxID=637853 RepID=A0A3P7NHD3_9BILA|nr:unnamed protein product [Gongylonema pulchrum]
MPYALFDVEFPANTNELKITELVPWSSCLAYQPILELLRPPALGELAIKKEVVLSECHRYAYCFCLCARDNIDDFVTLHETMRVKRVVGLIVFPAAGTFMLLPNSLFSQLLCLPLLTRNAFHCLYLTNDLNCSLITGRFELMTVEEKKLSKSAVEQFYFSNEFTRPLLLQDRVDGLDPRIQELVRITYMKDPLRKESPGCKLGTLGEEKKHKKTGNVILL